MRKGRHHSEETKRKLSEALKGSRNPNFGKPKSEEWKQNLRLKLFGKNNVRWKGSNVDLHTLHQWLRKWNKKPKLCEICHKVPPYDLANISGKYKRDIKDYKWVCRHCHMVEDGRIEENLKRLKMSQMLISKNRIKRNKEINLKCPLCESYNITRRGFTEGKIQRYECKPCNVRFTKS